LPGLSAATAIRIDPALKTATHTRAGIAGGNPSPPTSAANATSAAGPRTQPRLPSTASPYRAAKIATAVAPLALDSGILPLVTECAAGINAVVNEAVVRIAVLPRLALGVARTLVSSLGPPPAVRTLPGYAASVNQLIRQHARDTLALPRASQLLFEAST